MRYKLIITMLLSCLLYCYTNAQWSVSGNAISSGNFLGTTNGEALLIKTNSTEKMRIDSAGNVGIGTTSASEKLHVAGNIRFSGALMPNNTAGTSGQYLKSAGSGTAPTWVSVTADAWGITGNSGTTPGTNFIGTTDDQDIVFKRNSLKAGLLNISLENTAFGVGALNSITTGSKNVAIGNGALYTNTTRLGLVAIGDSALAYTTGSGPSASGNTAVGYRSLTKNTSGSKNTATGYFTLTANTTSGNNTAFGYSVLSANTTGASNTGIGTSALQTNTTGSSNTAIGNICLGSNTTGYSNVAMGYTTLFNNSTGYLNSAIGNEALKSNTTGYNNTALGSYGLQDNTTGNDNTSIGDSTGLGITTGSYNTIIGAHVTGLSSSLSKNIILADGQGNRRINVDANGNVGIATTSPNSNAKLTVNGNIFTNGKIAIGDTNMAHIGSYSLAVNGEAIFTKAKVKLNGAWPDYVFENDFGLLPIAQLADYINKNKHLPGIPSAAEVQRNGIDLGDNQIILLKKVEELTLYIIDQQKQIDQLKDVINKNSELGDGQQISDSPIRGVNPSEKPNISTPSETFGENPGNVAGSSTSFWTSDTTKWSIDGNIGTTSSNFIGTSDNQPIYFRVNNTSSGKIASNGFINYGYEAGKINTEATNTAIGHQAFKSITTNGDWSTAVGYQAGYSTTTGWNSTYLGYQAGYSNTTARDNTGIGTMALAANTARGNTAVGVFALKENTTGVGNVALGFSAGAGYEPSDANVKYYSKVDNYATFIGYAASRDSSIANTTSLTNITAIGKNAKVGASNSIVLGGTGVDTVNVGIGTKVPTQRLDVRGNIYSSGKILIGTSGLNTGGYSLAVNGSAVFTKAVVKLSSAWPDYIFADDFGLLPISELAEYIQKNKHLPGVSSADEVERNGIDLGDNQTLLLKKVEELTLYIIQQDKVSNIQQEKITAMEKRLNAMEKKIEIHN